jgi:hypothetical protein
VSAHSAQPMKSQLLVAIYAAMLASTSCEQTQASVNGCEQSIETVRSGRLASRQDERAWSALPGCGAAAGLAARDAWTSLRSSSDTARFAKVFHLLRGFRDASLFVAASSVLLDTAASAPARVYSAMLAVGQVRPLAEPDYHVFSTTGPHDPCVAASVGDGPVRDGAPLLPNESEQMTSAALRVMTDSSAPQSVRNAARCMYDTVTGESTTFASARSAAGTTGHVRESAGRLDSVTVLASATSHRSGGHASRPHAWADSIRGRIGLAGGGGCVMQQPYLETSAGKRFRLDGSRRLFEQLPGFPDGRDPFHQLQGLEIVVFGRESHPPTHPVNLPYPLFTIDSFLVRARQETRVHDGILHRGPRGDLLETRDGRRLPVANTPSALQKADGMRVWIGEPLGAPAIAGVIDPGFRIECPE